MTPTIFKKFAIEINTHPMKRTKPILALWTLLRSARMGQTIQLLFLMLLAALTEGFGILMLVPLLESLTSGKAGTSGVSAMIWPESEHLTLGWLLCAMIALTALRSFSQHRQTVLSATIQNRIVDNLRLRCFGGLVSAEWRWLSAKRSTDHAALLINNIGRIGVGFGQAMSLVASAVSLLACLGAALLLSWQMAVSAGAFGIILLALFGQRRAKAFELGHSLSAANRKLHGSVQEGIAGTRLAKIWQGEHRLVERFRTGLETVHRQQIAFIVSTGLGRSATQIFGAVLVAGIVYSAVEWQQMSYAVLLPLILVFGRLVPILATIQQNYQLWLHALPVLGEVQNLIDETSDVAELILPNTAVSIRLQSELAFSEVGYCHAEREIPVLAGASFVIKAGSVVAMTGESGAGKSTLGDLVAGLIEPTTGKIFLDGIQLGGMARQQWRRSVAYVEQDIFLFNDSVRANLLWASPDANDDALATALKAASADFAFALPAGLNTIVGDGGTRLSGGERQRLGLARALLGRPSLLILDEATSALDRANELAIRRAILKLRGTLTIILIGHRQWITDIADLSIDVCDGLARCNSATSATSST